MKNVIVLKVFFFRRFPIFIILGIVLLVNSASALCQSSKVNPHPHLIMRAYLVLNFDDNQALELFNRTERAINAKKRCFTRKTGIDWNIRNREAIGKKPQELEDSGDEEYLSYSNKVKELYQEEAYYVEECWEGAIPSAKELRNIIRKSLRNEF